MHSQIVNLVTYGDCQFTAEDPPGQNMFETREPSNKNPLLGTNLAQSFHRSVAQLLYLCARARRDIHTAVAFLTKRVRAPDTDDWGKLRRVSRYLYRNPGLTLTLETNNLKVMDWHMDASFAVHPDMKGHTGGTMTLGKGSIIGMTKFFYVTDQIKQGWLTVKHCHTKEMVADIYMKPLNGELFRQVRAKIMNCPVDLEPAPHLTKAALTLSNDEPQECVGRGGAWPGGDRSVSWSDVAKRRTQASTR